MVFGYARISTGQQNIDMQIDAIKAVGVEEQNIFTDVTSGAKKKRPGLDELLTKVREGDKVVVWKCCRLARNLKHMLSLMEIFKETGVEFKSIQEPFVDTTSPQGRFMFNIFSCMNELERETNRERVIVGLEMARQRGKTGGRPRGLSERLKKLAPAVASMWKDNDRSIREIKDMFNISQASVYKCLKHEGIDIHKNGHHKNIKNRKL